jgi:hypothetical protein
MQVTPAEHSDGCTLCISHAIYKIIIIKNIFQQKLIFDSDTIHNSIRWHAFQPPAEQLASIHDSLICQEPVLDSIVLELFQDVLCWVLMLLLSVT